MTIAEFKLRLLEKTVITNEKRISKWVRYVDDVFAIVKKDEIDNVLEDLNKYDPNIQFTIERVENNRIPFLDVMVNIKDGKLETSVYRKPTQNSIIIPKCSDTTNNYKVAALRNYINRAKIICSSEKILKEEIKIIKQIAVEAGHKEQIVDKLIKSIENKNKTQNENDNKNKIKFKGSIHHQRDISNKFKNIMRKYKIGIAIKPNPSLYQIIRSDKEKIDPKEKSGIYEIKCKDQTNDKEKIYIGMTSRRISERVKEHKRDLANKKATTALAKYNLANELQVDTENVKRIAEYRSKRYAIKREAIEIVTREERAVNFMEHYIIDERWRHILTTKKDKHAKRQQGIQAQEVSRRNVNATEDGPDRSERSFVDDF